MKNLKKYTVAILCALSLTACSDYLNVVPDDVATLDNAFSSRAAAEKFLFGCFNYMPNMSNAGNNPAIFGGDDCWGNMEDTYWNSYDFTQLMYGNQNSNNPLFNYWDGGRGGKNMWTGIRDCNIFLENITPNGDTPHDLQLYERKKWIAEVKFLKAYFHFWMFQLYGPVPITDSNIDVSASPDQVRVYRNTVDECVDYICDLLDEAADDLPLEIQQAASNAGRPTQVMAKALKAKCMVLAASPLFNGNPDVVQCVDNRGVHIFGQDTAPDQKKWEAARDAVKEAIDLAHSAQNKLYTYQPTRQMSDSTALKLTIRGSVSQKWNDELIWGDTHSVDDIQRPFFPRFRLTQDPGAGCHIYGMTLKVAERFYTNNGIPMNEDPTYPYANRYSTKECDEASAHQYYIKLGETTALLNFYREPRFYASLGFDRGIWEGAGVTDDQNSLYIQARYQEAAGNASIGEHHATGYDNKKIANYETAITGQAIYQSIRYAFPIIRLADLYLLYAECLNECGASTDEVCQWIDPVRQRAGLKGVVESWSKSTNPGKPNTQEGMRNIIKQERGIEFACEFQRFWDLRRWKDAVKEYNKVKIQGWNYKGEDAADYYNIQTYHNKRVYTAREYFWPVSIGTLTINPNLVQNPGWEE